MWNWLKELDRVLRGEATRMAALRGEDIKIPAAGLSVVIFLLAVVYGVCLGCFAVFRADGPVYMQMAASAVKVPALFFLTLAITFPSLYVFNALVGSRLSLPALLRLLIASLGVNVAVLSSLGPIFAFFSLSTTSYGFMVLLNVLMFTVSGVLGLVFLLQTLHRLNVAPQEPVPPTAPPLPAALPGEPAETEAAPLQLVEAPAPLAMLPRHVLGRQVKTVFNCWVAIFALVGAQMGWVLRPFIGSPSTPFQWFRGRESNFFEAVFHTFRSLFS